MSQYFFQLFYLKNHYSKGRSSRRGRGSGAAASGSRVGHENILHEKQIDVLPFKKFEITEQNIMEFSNNFSF